MSLQGCRIVDTRGCLHLQSKAMVVLTVHCIISKPGGSENSFLSESLSDYRPLVDCKSAARQAAGGDIMSCRDQMQYPALCVDLLSSWVKQQH
jgi:hypothetical protein